MAYFIEDSISLLGSLWTGNQNPKREEKCSLSIEYDKIEILEGKKTKPKKDQKQKQQTPDILPWRQISKKKSFLNVDLHIHANLKVKA